MKYISFLILIITMILIGYNYKTHDKETETVIGGEFFLQDQDGKEISNKNLLNHHTMIFFGFSRCPHICPTHLGIMFNILEEIDDEKLQAFFVTIDPKHDNLDRLKDYHEQFDSRIQMLTGAEQDIKKMIKDYKIYVSSSQKPEEINHSTIIYIMGPKGKYLDHLNFTTSNINESIKYLRDLMKN